MIIETLVLYGALTLHSQTYLAPIPKTPTKPVMLVNTSPVLNRRQKDLDNFISFLKDLIKPKSKSKQKRRWRNK